MAGYVDKAIDRSATHKEIYFYIFFLFIIFVIMSECSMEYLSRIASRPQLGTKLSSCHKEQHPHNLAAPDHILLQWIGSVVICHFWVRSAIEER